MKLSADTVNSSYRQKKKAFVKEVDLLDLIRTISQDHDSFYDEEIALQCNPLISTSPGKKFFMSIYGNVYI